MNCRGLLALSTIILMYRSVEGTAEPRGQDCAEVFQAQLRRLLALRKTCNSAGFNDCCQVAILHTASIPLSILWFGCILDKTADAECHNKGLQGGGLVVSSQVTISISLHGCCSL